MAQLSLPAVHEDAQWARVSRGTPRMKRRAEETEWPETAIAHKHLSRTFIGMSIDVMPCTSAMSVASVESIHGLQEEQDLMGFERELARVLPENHAACPRAPPPTPLPPGCEVSFDASDCVVYVKKPRGS